MSNFVRDLLGLAYVQEDERNITIGGIKSRLIGMDIMSEWGTNRIEKFMFTKFTSGGITFNKFFAPDIHYILHKLAQNRHTRTPRRVLLSVLKELEENTWLARISQEVQPILDRSKAGLFKFELKPHQVDFLDTYEQRTQKYGLNGYLLSAGPGSGKTLTGLVLAAMLDASVTVVVCPKNAVYKVWDRHLKEVSKVPQETWIAADGKPYNGQKFLIIHFEALEKSVSVIKQSNTSNPVVLLDESHNLNNTEALRTQVFVNLCQQLRCKHVLWASGTPIKALGQEAIPLLKTIDPLFNQDAEVRFRKIYGAEAKRALSILQNRMGIISFRVDTKDVVDNGAKTYTVNVKIPNGKDYTLATIRKEMETFIDDKTRYYKKNFSVYEKQYNDALSIYQRSLITKQQKEDFDKYKLYIKEIRRGYDPVALKEQAKYCNDYELNNIMPSLPQAMRPVFKSCRSVIKYVELKVMGEALGAVLGKKRAQCHLDMIPYMGLPEIIESAAKKTVIFTSYVVVVDAVRDYVKDAGFEPLYVYGETSKDLATHVTTFEQQPKANPMVATYQSLSTAVPLIVANTVCFTNQPWRDNEMQQAKARVDRLGQDTPVRFYNIFLDTGNEPNISTRAREIIDWSRAQVEQILGVDIPQSSLVTMEEFQDQINDIAYHYDRACWVEEFCDCAIQQPEFEL